MFLYQPQLIILCFGLVILSEDTSAHHIKTLQCRDSTDEDGLFHYVQKKTLTEPPICLSMFRAKFNQKIEITIETHNVSCETAGEIAYIDGLNLQDDYFPGLNDSEVPPMKRMSILCDQMGRQTFLANQNVATILFRFPKAGRAFTLRVRHIHNPEPCNVVALHPNATGTVKIQNFGHRRNCSYLILYPTRFTVLENKVGYNFGCKQGSDFFEIRSGGNIDPLKSTQKVADSCQYALSKRVSGNRNPFMAMSPCYASVVRLVSSGKTNNRILVNHKPMDLREADQICPMNK